MSGELRRAFATAELARRDAVAAALRRAGARHVALDAPAGDWLRGLGTGAAMSFQAPLFLLGLRIVPLALAAWRWPAAGRPATRALPGAADARGGRAAHAALAPERAARAALPGPRRPGARARPARSDGRRAGRAGLGRCSSRTPPARWRRRTSSRRGSPRRGRRRPLPRPRAGRAAGRARRVLERAAHRAAPDRDRTRRAAVDWLAADGGTATGDALDRRCARSARGRRRPPAAIVLLSDGARQAGAIRRRSPRGARRGRARCTRSRSAPPTGIVESGGEVLPVPPDPEALAEVAGVRRREVRRRGRGRARPGLRAPRLEDRDAPGEAGDQRGLRRRGPAPARRVAADVAAVARAAAVAVGAARVRRGASVRGAQRAALASAPAA